MKPNTSNICLSRSLLLTRCVGSARSRSHGFTMIELMVALVVAAILLAIAIPSFTYLTVSSRLTTTANELVNRLSLARSDAIKRNTVIRIAADGAVSVLASGEVISPAIALPNSVTYSTSKVLNATQMGMLQEIGGSSGYTGLVVDVGSSRISTNNHRCVYVTTGTMVTSCTDSSVCGGGAPNATCK